MRELGAAEFAAWGTLQEADPQLASPFFRPEFAAAVARVRDDVRVAVIERAGACVGFFPFQKGAFSVGHPVGGPLSDAHGFILGRETASKPGQIVRACGLAEWRFDHLPAGQAAALPGLHTSTESPIMDLAQGYEAYASARRAAGSEQILKTSGLLRKMERDLGPVRFTLHTPEPELLRTLRGWKSAQYRASGKVDIFSIGWVGQAVETLHATSGAGFASVLSVLWLGDRPLAAHLGLRSRTVWHYWLPAYDPAFAKYSPGLILLLKMAEHAAALGVSTIDLGVGRALYKQRLMSGTIPLAEGRIIVSPARAALAEFRTASERWVRRSAFFETARGVRRAVAGLGGRLPFLQRMKNHLRFR